MNRVMIFTPVFKSIFVETWSDTAKMVSGLLEEQKTCLHINRGSQALHLFAGNMDFE